MWIPLQKQGEKPLIVVRLAGRRSHFGTEGHFCPLLQKKEAHLPKAVSQKLIHPVLHPYLNSSVHFAQFSADLDNIPNMTRS